MFDVNQITTTLRGLPDRMLQQYAMMNKGNPYVLSLAVAESNQRKQLRTAAQTRNAMPQPKVADAAIAGMTEAPAVDAMGNVTGMASGGLPEDQGIARLPTPNMQNMANGGIAGYEDDEEGMATGGMGGMFNFAQQSEPVVRMAEGGAVQRYQFGGVTYDPATGVPISTPLIYGDTDDRTTLERLGVFNPENRRALEKAAREKAAREKAAKEAKEAKTPGAKAAAAAAAAVDTPAAKKDDAADKALVAAPTPQVKMPTGIATITPPTAEDATAASNKFFDADALTRRLDQQRLQERQDIFNQKETRLAQLDAFNKEKGPAFAGYEKLLQKEELQDATDKEKSGLMSLMKGFLAMAAGESPNAATNIAKGAMVGLGDYGDALKEFKKAAKERNKAMADIEQARRAEARGDLKDTQMYEDRADTRMAESDRAFTNAVTQITGKKGEIASGIYKDMVNNAEATKRLMYSEAAQTARTNAQINAPSGIEKIVDRMARDPKFAESYKNYASIGPEAKGDAALLAKYAGPQGQIALQMLEAEGPEGKLQAQLIRQKLQAAMLTPTSKPTGPVRE